MACGCGTYTPPTINNCNITATVCMDHYIDIIPAHTVVILGAAGFGTATLLPNGNIRYVPEEGFSGDDGLVYTWASGSCTIIFEVIEGIPADYKVIILTASAECEVGTATYEWTLPPCAELAPGYTIYDNPIHVIVPLYDPQAPDATCDISVNICCDFCNNCCKCEHFIWDPPMCIYPCGEDPICECTGQCETYNPTTGNCDPCLNVCCEIAPESFLCKECCVTLDCPANQQCITGVCGCPPGTIINQYGACCPTTLPSCAICDAAGNVVENVNLDCEDNEEIDYETCTCICTEGLCRDIITGLCVECPPCVPTAGRLQYSGVSGYEAYTETCPACQNCVACVECPGGFECVDTPCAATGACNGVNVPLIPNPLPFVSYTDPCTGLTVVCSEEVPCCCKKNPPPTVTTFICQEGSCHPHNGACDEDDDDCYEDIDDCNDACGGPGNPDIGACCVGVLCSYMTAEECETANGVFGGINSLCSELEPCVEEIVGACCKDSVCYTATQEDCEADGGTYVGNGVACDGDTCDEVNPLCTSFPEIDTDYTCGNNISVTITDGIGRYLQFAIQTTVGGPFVNIGIPTLISTDPYVYNFNFSGSSVPVNGQIRFTILATDDCPEVVLIVTRLACEPEPPVLVWCCHDNICEQITVAQCTLYEGIVYGSSHTCGINCLPDVNPLPMGCCHNGNCTEVYSAEECPGILYGLPSECETSCITVGPPPPTGACCISGSCYGGMTEDDCTESGGIYYGDETLCLAEDCESPCEDITTTGVITQDEIIIPQNYIYIPAWSNGNSI